MTLEKYVRTLVTIRDLDEPFHERDYKSHTTGRLGYWAEYKVGDDWLWYSVSDTSGSIVLPSAVLNAIGKGVPQRAGTYKRNGFEATFRFNGHSYMLGLGNKRPKFKN